MNEICRSSRNISGQSLPNAFVLCRNGDAAIGRQIDTAWLKFLIAHELFHAYQWQLAGAILATSDKTVLEHDGPQWLTEGAAQAVANHLTTGLPISEYGQRMVAKLDGNVPSLTVVDDRSDLKKRRAQVYRTGVVAIAQLIPDEDYKKLGDFYVALGRANNWTEAFSAVFGKTVQEFYSEFDRMYQ